LYQFIRVKISCRALARVAKCSPSMTSGLNPGRSIRPWRCRSCRRRCPWTGSCPASGMRPGTHRRCIGRDRCENDPGPQVLPATAGRDRRTHPSATALILCCLRPEPLFNMVYITFATVPGRRDALTQPPKKPPGYAIWQQIVRPYPADLSLNRPARTDMGIDLRACARQFSESPSPVISDIRVFPAYLQGGWACHLYSPGIRGEAPAY